MQPIIPKDTHQNDNNRFFKTLITSTVHYFLYELWYRFFNRQNSCVL